MRITIKTIPHAEQRLGTVGDWYFEDENLFIFITELGDWRYNYLFARHEMDEAMLCRAAGITTEMVDKEQIKASDTDDPDSFSGYPNAIHQNQHNDALASEWQLSRLLGVDWKAYGEAVRRAEKE